MTDRPTDPQPTTTPDTAEHVAAPAPAIPAGYDSTGAPTPPPAATDDSSRGASRTKRILSAVGVVAMALALKFTLGYILSDKPVADSLAVGQCVARGDDDALTKVECTDPKASFKVLFIKKDTTEASADETCAPYAETTNTYFEAFENETKGNVLCLGPSA